MSSKSRREVPRPPPATVQPASEGAQPAHPQGERRGEHGLLGEEVIHVPKGRNRLQFAMLIALLVFLTVIYLVPGAIQNTVRGSKDPDTLSFRGPDGDRMVLRASEYQKRRNGFADVLELFPILKFFVGIQDRNLSEESAARLIVLDELARASGIVITDDELAQFLIEAKADREGWVGATSRYGGARVVEANLKRVLAIRRYLDLVGQVARVPDMQAIEKRWAEEHVEIAYDYVEVPAESLEAEARAAAPDDAALEAWLAERPEFEKSALMEPVRYRATFAVFRDPASTPASGLVARYPDTSGEAPEVRAQAYYNQVYFARFIRPEKPDEAKEGEEPEEPADGQAQPEEPPTPYLSFEEVREQALAEAPVYFALQAWHADLAKRVAAGEEVDLAAEANDLGLAVARVDEPATLEGLRAVEGLGDFAVGPVATTESGKIADRVVADKAGLLVVRVDEKLEPSLPPFEKIRDQVLTSWAKSRGADLALERLEAIRAGFETLPPEEKADEAEDPLADLEGEEEEPPVEQKRATAEAFRAAVEAAGFTVAERPYLDKSGPPTDDPDMAKPGHSFLGQHREYGDLDADLVPPAELDRQRAHAYLVRVAGKRELDLARMTPQVYNSYKSASAMEPANQVRLFLTGPDLDEQYAITWLVKRETPPPEEGAEEPAEEPAAGEEAGG